MSSDNNLPIYRYLFMMSRNGFTSEDFIKKINGKFKEENCLLFLENLIIGRILKKENDKYFFVIQNYQQKQNKLIDKNIYASILKFLIIYKNFSQNKDCLPREKEDK